MTWHWMFCCFHHLNCFHPIIVHNKHSPLRCSLNDDDDGDDGGVDGHGNDDGDGGVYAEQLYDFHHLKILAVMVECFQQNVFQWLCLRSLLQQLQPVQLWRKSLKDLGQH